MSAASPGPEWKKNTGKCPDEAKGKRVRVWLACGHEGSYDDNPMSPPSWAADGKGACSWKLTGGPHNIAFYQVIG